MARRGKQGGAWPWVKRGFTLIVVLVALVLVAALVLALVPVGTGGLGAEPEPATTYGAAIDRYEEISAAEGDVRPECRSRLYTDGKRADRVVVLFHGLTNCPRQMVELAEELHDDDATVLVLRAPDHGLRGDVGQIGGVDAEDFRDYADDAVDIASGLGDEVTVMGLSLGGMLSAWAAEERPEVDRAVVIAPALAVGGVPGFVADGFTNLFSRLPNVKLPSGGDALPHAYPPAIATRPTAQMFRLGKHVEDAADSDAPAAPVALVLNDNDKTISNDAADSLAAAWEEAGTDVTVVRLPKSWGLPHDVVDVAQPKQRVDDVYPVLVALAEGKQPPAVPAA
jgi:alpha-beta hydrolase superfamily lysophospholipase